MNRGQRVLERVEMSNGCHVKTRSGGEYQYTPLVAAGGREVVVDLETVQLERGLYCVLVVRGPDEPVVDRDRVLVFDDVRLDRRRDWCRSASVAFAITSGRRLRSRSRASP
jgi:hypothetical protein